MRKRKEKERKGKAGGEESWKRKERIESNKGTSAKQREESKRCKRRRGKAKEVGGGEGKQEERTI